MTLPQAHAYGPMGFLGSGAFSDGRDASVHKEDSVWCVQRAASEQREHSLETHTPPPPFHLPKAAASWMPVSSSPIDAGVFLPNNFRALCGANLVTLISIL